MTRGKRLLTLAAVLIVTLVVGWALVLGAAFAMGGMLIVEVHDRYDDFHLYLPLPMAALDLVAAAAAVPAVHTAGFGSGLEIDGLELDLGELGPLVVDLLEALEEMPDATLVEVEDGRERVLIVKEGRKLIVEVEEPGTSVRVALPTHGVRRVASRLLD